MYEAARFQTHFAIRSSKPEMLQLLIALRRCDTSNRFSRDGECARSMRNTNGTINLRFLHFNHKDRQSYARLQRSFTVEISRHAERSNGVLFRLSSCREIGWNPGLLSRERQEGTRFGYEIL